MVYANSSASASSTLRHVSYTQTYVITGTETTFTTQKATQTWVTGTSSITVLPITTDFTWYQKSFGTTQIPVPSVITDSISNGLSGGKIAGIVVGSVGFISILLALLLFCCRRKHKSPAIPPSPDQQLNRQLPQYLEMAEPQPPSPTPLAQFVPGRIHTVYEAPDESSFSTRYEFSKVYTRDTSHPHFTQRFHPRPHHGYNLATPTHHDSDSDSDPDSDLDSTPDSDYESVITGNDNVNPFNEVSSPNHIHFSPASSSFASSLISLSSSLSTPIATPIPNNSNNHLNIYMNTYKNNNTNKPTRNHSILTVSTATSTSFSTAPSTKIQRNNSIDIGVLDESKSHPTTSNTNTNTNTNTKGYNFTHSRFKERI